MKRPISPDTASPAATRDDDDESATPLPKSTKNYVTPAGFKRLKLDRAMVIGVRTDILFPVEQQRELADGISSVCPDTRLAELDCIRGHDSFLVDMDAFRPVICEFFDSCCE